MGDSLQAENDRLREQVRLQAAQIEKLTAMIEELRRKQHRPHAPFSKGDPKPNPKPPGRKSGDDYGNKAFRAVPPRIDEVYAAALPDSCPHCGGAVKLERIAEQYQTEIPRVEPLYRKFNVAVGSCNCCGKRVQGRHPLQSSNALGAARSQMGPQAQALATLFNKEFGLSHGKVVRLFSMLCNVALTRGASAQIMLRAARHCSAAYREIQIVIKQSSFCVPDETGWRVGGVLQWLHVFATEIATLYLIRPSRGFDVAVEALGADYHGNMTHDGWAPYNRFEQANHQQCTAHLLRRCGHLLEEAHGAAAAFPRKIKALLQEGLALREAREAGKVTEQTTARQSEELERRLNRHCGKKTHVGNERLAAFLMRHAGSIFEYLRTPCMDATNWRAEQAIRPAVVNRKVWGGSRTEKGSKAQGILMSVLRTAAQQGHQLIEYLTDSLRAPPGHEPRLISATAGGSIPSRMVAR